MLGSFFSSLFASGKVDVWKRFERMRESTSGTMSSFFQVRDRKTGQVVGLKIIDVAKAAPVEGRYKSLNKPSEAEIASRIVGPNVVRTLEWGTTTAGEPFIVMEYLDGTLLHSLLAARKPMSPAEKLDLVRQAATAIAAVHTAGFVHRDICPRNFILCFDGRLVLIDFGLSVPDTAAFLQPGNRVGTPDYMAPEVVRRRPIDRRLDVFSFGVTAYEICTGGHTPWPRGKTGMAALAHDTAPIDICTHWPDIPSRLAAAVMSCLEAEPERRPPTLARFLAQISGVRA